MNIFKILCHDYWRAKDPSKIPILMEVKCSQEFLPVIVSSGDFGRFIRVDKISQEGYIRTAVFNTPNENIDGLIKPLLDSIYLVNSGLDQSNIFHSSKEAFDYVKNYNDGNNPKFGLYPDTMSLSSLKKKLVNFKDNMFNDSCRMFPCNTSKIVLVSKPELVGTVCQFSNSFASVVVYGHNKGMSFIEL